MTETVVKNALRFRSFVKAGEDGKAVSASG
jgi:hypothetical protein